MTKNPTKINKISLYGKIGNHCSEDEIEIELQIFFYLILFNNFNSLNIFK